jgi:hypothetical protein
MELIMSSLQKRLVYIVVLVCIIIGINYLFYRSDKKMIYREAQAKEWTDTTIQWLFSPSPTLRHYRVTYTDGLGVTQKKHVLVELTEVTWKEDE